MSSRPQLNPEAVIVAGDMSGSLTSDVTIIQKISYISYSLVFTGTPTGTFNVQVSNDYSQNADGTVKNAGNWVSLVLSATTTATGSAGTGFIDIDGCAAYAMRLIYTVGSGSGTLNATVAGKVA